MGKMARHLAKVSSGSRHKVFFHYAKISWTVECVGKMAVHLGKLSFSTSHNFCGNRGHMLQWSRQRMCGENGMAFEIHAYINDKLEVISSQKLHNNFFLFHHKDF